MLSKTQARKWAVELKFRLQSAGVTYRQVAREAQVSWNMVYMVVNGARTSAKVMSVIDRLCDGTDTPVN